MQRYGYLRHAFISCTFLFLCWLVTNSTDFPSIHLQPNQINLPRASLNSSVLAYMHIAKTSGTTFNVDLTKQPFTLAESPTSRKLNCGLLNPCCQKNVSNVTAAVLSVADRCPHVTYEAVWPVWNTLSTSRKDVLILTHLRSPFWHVLSMLGHDLKAGRMQTYHDRLSYWDKNLQHNRSAPETTGYNLHNFFHSRFGTQDTKQVVHLLRERFVWFGIVEYRPESRQHVFCISNWVCLTRQHVTFVRHEGMPPRFV